MRPEDQIELVRAGYDALSYYYRADEENEAGYTPWLDQLRERLPIPGAVLDIGCGCGVPVARSLAASGYDVTGVDVSQVQIDRARRLVPTGTFVRADATRIAFPPDSFDAVICLYALIHMPLERQPRLLASTAHWLRPGGWLLTITGHRAWAGSEANWLGGPATMLWSHADAASYRRWIEQASLRITAEVFVPEGDGGHALFWAKKPAR